MAERLFGTIEYEYPPRGRIDDLKSAPERILNGYILQFVAQSTHRKCRDEELWDSVQEHFYGWTVETFLAADKEAVTELRDYLRGNGVWVFKARFSPIAEHLAELLEEKEPHQWTEQEVLEEAERAAQEEEEFAEREADRRRRRFKRVQRDREVREALADAGVGGQPPKAERVEEVGGNEGGAGSGGGTTSTGETTGGTGGITGGTGGNTGGNTGGTAGEAGAGKSSIETKKEEDEEEDFPRTTFPTQPGSSQTQPGTSQTTANMTNRTYGYANPPASRAASYGKPGQKQIGYGGNGGYRKPDHRNWRFRRKECIVCFDLGCRSTNHPLIFNGTKISQDGNDILITSKGQNEKIKLVDTSLADFKTEYKVERARGAYQATICQPKVAFGLSVAAQHQENPTVKHAEALNKCLEWQIGNKQRGLRMKPINMETAKLYVWVDGSFANLEGGASQIGYFVTIGNEEPAGENEFKFRGNAVDWSSTKCHRVARATLASELFAMVNGVDVGIALSTTLAMITKELGLPDIPVVILTDSRSLYECIVKLGTTKEKRLMIDVMAIREAYEKEEVLEIRWINGADNIGDAFTKENPNKALDTFLDTNEIVVRLEGWVKRS